MKKILYCFILLMFVFCFTGCESKNVPVEDSDSPEKIESSERDIHPMREKRLIYDDLITVTLKEKVMKGNYPSVLLHIQNNSSTAISIEPLGNLNGQNRNGRFIITNSEGKWTSPNILFQVGEEYDVYFGYSDTELSLDDFVDVDLTFHVSEKNEYGGWNFVKDLTAHID